MPKTPVTRLKLLVFWVLATVIGWAVGSAMGTAMGKDEAIWVIFGPWTTDRYKWLPFVAYWGLCGAIGGMLTGLTQWSLLRRLVGKKGTGWWVLVTALGLGLGWAMGAGVAGAISERLQDLALAFRPARIGVSWRIQIEIASWAMTSNGILVGGLVIGGAVAGLGQFPLLWRWVGKNAVWWVLAITFGTTISCAIATVVATVVAELSPWLFLPPDLPRFISVGAFVGALAAGGATVGAITGNVLVKLLFKNVKC